MKQRKVKHVLVPSALVFISVLAAVFFSACPLEPGVVHSSLDTGFAGNGIFHMMITPDVNYGKAVAVTGGGYIIVGCEIKESLEHHFALVCLDPDGEIYAPFGAMGVRKNTISGVKTINRIILQPDGKILAAVEYYKPSTGLADFAIVRYTSSGDIDTTFSSDGMAVADYHGQNDYAVDLALQPDGKIVAAGFTCNPYNTVGDLAAVRFNADGSIDATFADDGIFVFSTPDDNERVYAVGVTPEGKIMLAGEMDYVTYPTCMCVMRLNTDGSLDDHFGFLGLAVVNPTADNEKCRGMALYPYGHVTLFGYHGAAERQAVIARLDSEGNADTTFGAGGSIILDLGAGYSRCVGGDCGVGDTLVVAGESGSGTNDGMVVAQCLANGSFVGSFGNGGIEKTSFGRWVHAVGMTRQPDGKILLVGTGNESRVSGVTSVVVARYIP